MKNLSKGLNDAIAKAVNTTAGTGGDFLPTPLANEFIQYVWDQNFLRQMFKTVPMISKTRDYPKVLGGTKVYYQPTEGATAIETKFQTGTVRLEAKKFMAYIELVEEVIEDAAFDMESIVQEHFAMALAAAEEEAMIVGDVDHTPTTATESLASGTTWYTKDHKLIWNGLLTLAGDIAGTFAAGTRAANRVNCSGNDATTALIRQALYNLGKYGRNMSDIVLILNPWSVNQLMDDSKLVTIDKYGPNATIITGEIGKLYGKISVINSAYCTDGYGVMTHKQNPLIGDRRRIKLARDFEVKTDSRIYVITERADFQVQHQPALCQLYNLDTPSSAS